MGTRLYWSLLASNSAISCSIFWLDRLGLGCLTPTSEYECIELVDCLDEGKPGRNDGEFGTGRIVDLQRKVDQASATQFRLSKCERNVSGICSHPVPPALVEARRAHAASSVPRRVGGQPFHLLLSCGAVFILLAVKPARVNADPRIEPSLHLCQLTLRSNKPLKRLTRSLLLSPDPLLGGRTGSEVGTGKRVKSRGTSFSLTARGVASGGSLTGKRRGETAGRL